MTGILANSLLGKELESNKIQLPPDEPLDGCAFSPLPYYLLVTIFFLWKNGWLNHILAKIWQKSRKCFDYRLSCCRRVVENAFVILSARWRIFHRPIRATLTQFERYVLAALIPHNYLQQTSTASYTPNGFADSEERDGRTHLGEWYNRHNRQCMENIRLIRGCRNQLEVIQMHEDIKLILIRNKIAYLGSQTADVWKTTFETPTYYSIYYIICFVFNISPYCSVC